MTEPETREAAISSAIDSVSQARQTLQRLKFRLHSEAGGSVGGYVEALENAASLTDELLELLTSRKEDPGSEVAGDAE